MSYLRVLFTDLEFDDSDSVTSEFAGFSDSVTSEFAGFSDLILNL